MSDERTAPILVRCEGSGVVSPHRLCPMCGCDAPAVGALPVHEREDILAELARGDFG